MMAINPAETRKADAYPRLSAMSPPKALPAQEPGVQARDERGEVPGPVLGRGVRHDEDLPGRG